MQTRVDELLEAARESQARGEREAVRYYIGEIERELQKEQERVRRMEHAK